MAMFECHVTSLVSGCPDRHIIEYYTQGNNHNITILARQFDCREEENDFSLSTNLYTLNVTVILKNTLSKNIYYRFYLNKINSSYNNSVFSCSVKVDNQIQWQKNATLTVLPVMVDSATSNTTQTQPPKMLSNQIKVLTPTLVLLITTVVLISSISVILIVVIMKRRKASSSNDWSDGRGKFL